MGNDDVELRPEDLPEVIPERWSDLLTQMAVAGFAAAAALVHPVGGLAGSVAAPALVRAAAAYRGLRGRQLESLLAAAEAEGIAPEAALELVAKNDRAALLFERALRASERAVAEGKLRTLGRALALGLLAKDEATIDAQERIIDAVALLEAVDVRVLSSLATFADETEQRGDLLADEISQRVPSAREVLASVLARLGSIGTLDQQMRYDAFAWQVNGFGRAVLKALHDAGADEFLTDE